MNRAERFGASVNSRESKNVPPATPIENFKEVGELVGSFIDHLSEVGGTYFDDVGEMYPLLQGEDFFVRREDPRSVMEALDGKQPIEVHTTQSTDPYPNAVEWNYHLGTHGLENAFLEGHAHMNGIVTVIGFTPRHVTKLKLSSEESSFVTPGGKIMDRSHVIAVDGTVLKEDIRFLVTKIPAKLVPERFLTEEEIDRLEANMNKGPTYIFRGVLLGESEGRVH